MNFEMLIARPSGQVPWTVVPKSCSEIGAGGIHMGVIVGEMELNEIA